MRGYAGAHSGGAPSTVNTPAGPPKQWPVCNSPDFQHNQPTRGIQAVYAGFAPRGRRIAAAAG